MARPDYTQSPIQGYDGRKLGPYLRSLRERRGYAQQIDVEDAAGRGVSNNALSRLELGATADPSFGLMILLAKLYAVPIEVLARRAGAPPNPYPLTEEAQAADNPALAYLFGEVAALPEAQIGQVIDLVRMFLRRARGDAAEQRPNETGI